MVREQLCQEPKFKTVEIGNAMQYNYIEIEGEMKFGRFEIHSISDGFFRLDGGAMFGVVPRAIWEKTNPPDDKNRILLGLNPLLIITEKRKILVDTGIGSKDDEKFRSMFAVDRRPTMEESLARLNLSVNDINIVISTHLHWDHAGGNTTKGADGKIRPAFPNATYMIQRGEWEEAMSPNERTRGSYHQEDFLPLKDAGQLKLIEGNTLVEDGIEIITIPGHNRHFQTALITSNNRKAIFLGDLIPTASHLLYPYIMGYDLFPLETLKAKKELLQKAAEEDWLLIFEHDPKVNMGYVRMENGKPVFKEEV